MISKCLCYYSILLLLIGQTVFAVTISGTVNEPHSVLDKNGNFVNVPVRIALESDIWRDQIFEAQPNLYGKFSIEIPVQKVAPAILNYEGTNIQLFLAPSENLEMRFSGDDPLNSMRLSGDGVLNNQYCLQFSRRFNQAEIEENLYQVRSDGKNRYFSSCETLRLQEMNLIDGYIAANPNLSPSFVYWAKSEVKFRYANRLSSFYIKSKTPYSDDYLSYVQQYNLNDAQALHSNQYLTFLENHLRQLTLRDPIDIKAAREAAREPWMLRGYQIAKQIYWGVVLENVAAKLILELIRAEHPLALQFYNDFTSYCTSPDLRALIDQRIGGLQNFLSVELPANANLFFIPEDQEVQFPQILQKYKGKVIFVDFWASWCKPCLKEMEFSVKLHEQFKGQDIVFTYFSNDDVEAKWKGNIAQFQVPGEHYLMNGWLYADAVDRYQLSGLPRYLLYNKQGQLISMFANRPSNPDLIPQLNKLINERF